MAEAKRLFTSQSPSTEFAVTYVREARLDRVRDELRRGDGEASVTAAATRWGFAHLGRFAVDYRRRFDESPSQTARRRG